MKEVFIVKKDGRAVPFDPEKIKNAVTKAFLSVEKEATPDMLFNILGHIRIKDGTGVEDIQSQVEIALMAEGYFDVAKSFILYRKRQA